jgi:hypothetical protein
MVLPFDRCLTLLQRYPKYAAQPGGPACIEGCVLGLILADDEDYLLNMAI